jgi:hypothetical protein
VSKPKFCETCQAPLNKKCECEKNMKERIEKVYQEKGIKPPKKVTQKSK